MKYLTTDSWNLAVAQILAMPHGIELHEADPRDIRQLEEEQADVILDWDYLSPMGEDRERLLNGTPMRVIGVHGFNLPPWSSFIAHRGVVVSTKLDGTFMAAVASVIAGRKPAA